MNSIIKIIVVYLFITTSLLSNEKVLKIGIVNDMVPYSYIDESGKPAGIFVDYWKLWSDKSQIEIKFVASTWSESLLNIKNKKIDIHSGMFKSKDREKYVDYLGHIYNTKGQIFINDQDKSKVTNINDLKSISVIKDCYYDQYLTTNYSHIKLKRFDDFKSLIDDVINNPSSAFIGDSLMVWFNFIKYSNFTKISALPDFELYNWFNVSIVKDNPKLSNIVKNGVDKITHQELVELEKKWILDPDSRYFSNLKQNTIFTEDELDYIHNVKEVKIGIGNWAPIYYVNDDNTVGGLVRDYLDEITKYSGLKFIVVKGSWNNILNKLKAKEIDLVPLALKNKEREKFGLFTNSYFNITATIYVRNDSSIKSFQDLQNKRLSILKGDARIPLIKELLPSIKLVEAETINDVIFKLLNKEVDATIEQDLIMETHLNKALITSIKPVLQNTIKPKPLYMFSKADDKLLNSILTKSLDSISEQRKNQIISRWLKKNNNLKFSNDELEFINKHNMINFTQKLQSPISITSNQKYTGFINDYIQIIEEKTGIKFNFIPSKSNEEMLSKFKNKEVSFLPITSLEKNIIYHKLGIVSNSYADFPFTIVSKNDSIFIDNNLDALNGKTFAIPFGSSSYEFITKNYPKIKIIETKTVDEALSLVSSDKAYAFIGHFAVSIYNIKNNYPNLRIIGKTENRIYHTFLINKEYYPLVSIVDKVIANIEESTHEEIKSKWIKVRIQNDFDYTLFLQIIGVILAVTISIIIWNRKLNNMVMKKTFELNSLLESFDTNVIASKTDSNGKIIYVSEAFQKISGYTASELINKNHNLIKHSETKKSLYKDLWETIKSGKIWKGEIKDKNKNGDEYWLYTIITPEYDLEENFLCYTAISQNITHEKMVITAKEEIEQLNIEISDTQKEVVFQMGAIAEARSKETGLHVKRVAEYSKLLALYYGIEETEAEVLKQASPMHDIGKVAIPDYILNKPGKLTFEEFEIMKTHAQLGYDMLKNSNKAILKAAAIVAHEHQEKYDGSGYPQGLKGDDIHIYGRITALADVFDALGSERVYKKAWDDERIFQMFKEERGKHFDPVLIDIFFNNIDEFLIIRDNMKDKIS